MKLMLAVLGLILCSVAAHQPPQMIRVPLQRFESGLEKTLRVGGDFLRNINLAVAVEKSKEKLAHHLKKADSLPRNDTLPIFKYFETQYYGVVNIGKPGKPFKFILDTAWGATWVPSVECPRTKLPCAIHERYDHTSSSTYKPDGRPFNVSGRYLGYFSRDLFHVGQMNASNLFFAELTDFPWWYALYGTDGTLGLGLKGLLRPELPFFYTFYQQNKLQPIFSLFINRDPTTPRGGSLFLGGIDYKHNKTEFNVVPIQGDTFWQFKMDKVSLIISSKSRVDFCQGGCEAFADTSSNTIVGPDADIRTINRLIGASAVPLPMLSKRFLIPCVKVFKGPKVSFTINKKEYVIKAQDYIQKVSYSGITICLSAFTLSGSTYQNNTWSLGGAFLYRYYTAYDVEKKVMLIAEAA